MNCENSQQVSAYHDGELSGQEMACFESHLEHCSQCQQDLRELRQLSRLLARRRMPQMSSAALLRLHACAESIGERGVLRIAEWLTAAAAAVLVVGLMVLFREQPASAQTVTGWEQVAVTPQVDALNTPTDPLQMADQVIRGDINPERQ